MALITFSRIHLPKILELLENGSGHSMGISSSRPELFCFVQPAERIHSSSLPSFPFPWLKLGFPIVMPLLCPTSSYDFCPDSVNEEYRAKPMSIWMSVWKQHLDCVSSPLLFTPTLGKAKSVFWPLSPQTWPTVIHPSFCLYLLFLSPHTNPFSHSAKVIFLKEKNISAEKSSLVPLWFSISWKESWIIMSKSLSRSQGPPLVLSYSLMLT